MLQQLTENLETRWDRDQAIKAHKRHLREISLRSKSTLHSPSHLKKINLRKLSQDQDKQREIERENFLLFIRLNSIKVRKLSPTDFHFPKSLNIKTRRKEAQRILNENYIFVKRFIEMPSYLSASQHVREFNQQQQYKKTISKANLHRRLVKLSSFIAKPGSLPPLDLDMLKIRSEDHSKLSNIDLKDEEKHQKINQLVDVDETQLIGEIEQEEYEKEEFEKAS